MRSLIGIGFGPVYLDGCSSEKSGTLPASIGDRCPIGYRDTYFCQYLGMRVPETAELRGLLGAVVGAVHEPVHPKLYGQLWPLYLGLSERNGEVSEGDRRDTIEEVLPYLPQVSRLGSAGYNAVDAFRTKTHTD